MTDVRTPALLVVMDGRGIAPAGPDNAISLASIPFWDSLIEKYPNTTLGASGEDVGLPAGQMGNSEVGHLNIGAGRIVYQSLSLINNAIKDGSIKDNPVLTCAMDAVIADDKTLHIMGLVSPGGVHSNLVHAEALVAMAAERGVKRIRIDAFTDGRDVAPQSGAGIMEGFVKYLEGVAARYNTDIAIATIAGRYYGMDRDNRWEREELAYNAIVLGEGVEASDPVEALKSYYEEDPRGDEFVKPVVLDKGGLNDGDAIIFFNFRPDRAREITRALTEPEFTGFERKKFANLASFVTMTEYDPTFNHVDIAFGKIVPPHVLADVISDAGLTQFHTAETEKYAHVTFFLNGGIEAPKKNETRVLIPSPKVATYDLQPEMSEPGVTARLTEAINNDEADFYVVNYANCDMVGHTGVVDAARRATEAVDHGLSKIIPAILAKGGFALITADHGNADHMYNEVDGKKMPVTSHTTSRVPLIIVDDKQPELLDVPDARLCDVAPTLLAMMGIERPAEMTGRVLIKQ